MRWRVLIWPLLSGALLVMFWCGSHKKSVLRHPTSDLRQHGASWNSAPRANSGSFNSDSPVRTWRRLANTTKSIDKLIQDPRAILLENAWLDTRVAVDLPIPPQLRSGSNPGSYIIQSLAVPNHAFRERLARAGAQVVAYIPNNAYLVRAQPDAASIMTRDPEVAAVIPYEPYFKIKASLMDLALEGVSLAEFDNTAGLAQATPTNAKVLVFAEDEPSALAQLNSLDVTIFSREDSPFGVVFDVSCPRGALTRIAQLPQVQEMEPSPTRVPANDLSRTRVGVSADSHTASNYLGLTGSNILVNVNDLGVDANHPDLVGRVAVDAADSGVDTDGHGTHVAGVIAGSGAESLTVSDAPGSWLPPVPSQFRGLAPAARILSVSVQSESRPFGGDGYLQQTAATNHARISNNSWHYANDTDYDLGAASYDAAVRDALPNVPGEQPVLFVFSAGNAGQGTDDGTGGVPGTIQSPGTAKNVITVGAIEQARFITNQTWRCAGSGTNLICQTNTPWLGLTDSSNQVAAFSSRGNVGPGIEGSSGRFKPDLVAPGTFVLSTRSTSWDQAAYYSASNSFLNPNPDPNYFLALSNLNQGVGPAYRFESGTSIAAAEAAGVLALMQEFFEQRVSLTNSPALMKALLINGARSLAAGYDFNPASPTNSQGWGIVQLPNSLPASLTNNTATNRSILFFDQSPAEALATDQRRTRVVSVSPAARAVPLRVTLVWTDPPGNPVAGLKLVNDLDLVVTNLESGEVFWGNDIASGAQFNSAWQAGTSPRLDRVNNVENVFLPPNLGSNYSVTVLARRVSVNSVTEQPSTAVQDYGLVISSGDGQVPDGLSLTGATSAGSTTSWLTFITNNFATDTDSGALLLQERVGASQPGFGTNSIPVPGSTNATSWIGSTNQWHFYVFTNDTQFTNAVFLTFSTKPLSAIPADLTSPGGAASGQIAFVAADVDLYVSRDSGLTNLDPIVLAAADTSLGRGGDEMIIYSNSTPGLYYVGVKCESLQGAEYGFVADVSLEPFAQDDAQGNEILRGFPEPAVVPPGTSALPGAMNVFFVMPETMPLRRVIVTNTLSYSSLADLQTALIHDSASAVLNNHSGSVSPGRQTSVFDDSGEGDLPGSIPSSGPGSLRSFSGQNGAGQWILTLITTNSVATNESATLFLERQPDPAGGIGATIAPGACRQDFISVPIQATNLTDMVSFMTGTGPISFQVFPLSGSASNCATILLTNVNETGTFIVDETSQPPLNPGEYVLRTCNLGPDPAGVVIQANTVLSPNPVSTNFFSTNGKSVVADNAVSSSTLMVTNTEQIVSVEVGVRIDHPRISDLVISLVSPDGTRVLLDSGRGDGSANGLGANAIVTNTTPVSFSGGPEAVTNVFETGQTAATILISYDFFALPDDMRVYYENRLLFDSGLVSSRGSTNLSYGPGTDTSFTVVMNQGGNSESNTSWFYSVTTTRVQPLYLTFTEDTNLTQTPLKFATPPFTNLTVAPGAASAGNGIFYLPEQSLGQLAGKSAFGQWNLEIWDSRAGMTNPPPTLVSWQLALTLARSLPLPVPLAPTVTATNLLGPGQMQWYEVDVPDWVSFATNSLVSSSQPVNLFFNASMPPTGTNLSDHLFAVKTTVGTWVFHTNGLPPLVPGSSYFLGIQNTNATTATVVFGVEFDISAVLSLTSGVPFLNINVGPLNSSDYYRFVASTNALRVQFEVNGPTNDVTLLAHKGPPLPSLGTYDYISANPGTNDEWIVVYDYSKPGVLLAGEWFLTVVNVTGSPAAYSILATEFSAYATNIVVSGPTVNGNALCLTWSSLPGIHYFVQAKSALANSNWVTVSPTLTASDVTTTFCIPLPSDFEYFRISEGIVLVPALPIISSLQYNTNSIVLQWSAPTNLLFQVQWSPSLVPTNWQSVPGRVSSVTGTFLFSDDGSQTGGLGAQRFYRLRQLP